MASLLGEQAVAGAVEFDEPVFNTQNSTSPYCSQCGAKTIRECPSCNSSIPGFNVNKAAEDSLFFRKTAKSALAASVFVEFFINLFVFGLLAELILQFVLTILIMVDAYSNQKPEFQQLKKVLDALLVGVGVLFLGYTIVQFYAQWTQVDQQALLLKFALPAWLTIGVLPFIYVLSLYAVYEGALRGVDLATSDWRARWRTRFVLVRDFRLCRNELRSFTWMWIKRAAVAPDVTGARAVVQQFRNEQRAAEQAERDAGRTSVALCWIE